MMNLFKLSEQLKDLSKDQLVQEMKAPSGAVPQFLVMSELQRRSRMEREAMTAEPAAQTTVAQDTVAAAGAPQGGLAQMAQALAPKTDMAGNTGNTGIAAMVPPVQRMQTGGEVEGPNTSRLRNLIDLQRALEEARVQSDVNRQRVLRAAEPSIADVEPLRIRLPDGGRDITPVDEFSGLPSPMTEPGIGGVEPSLRPIMEPNLRPTMEDAALGLGVGGEFAVPSEGGGGIGLRDIGRFVVGDIPGRTREIAEGLGFGPAMTAAGIEPSDEVRERIRAERAAEEAAERIRGGRDVYEPEPAGAPPSARPDLLEDMSEAVAPPARETEDAPGGAGDGAGGAADLDRMYEQDRWLALARFGLGLMSSREPTLGGAIGEAGAGALDYMTGARESMLDRRMQERELALQEQALALRAAGDTGPNLNQMIQRLQDQQELLGTQLLTAETEAQRVATQERLNAIQTQLDALLGLPAVETTTPAVDARPGFFERLFN